MVVRSSAMAAAAGMTALVEEVGDGTRVTLRPCGVGRWVGVAFLSFWLAGWACGEVFALVFLVGWLLASLVRRYGGLPWYRRLRPFFLGLILGDAVSYCLMALLECTLRVGAPA